MEVDHHHILGIWVIISEEQVAVAVAETVSIPKTTMETPVILILVQWGLDLINHTGCLHRTLACPHQIQHRSPAKEVKAAKNARLMEYTSPRIPILLHLKRMRFAAAIATAAQRPL
jgi:hypothetical protein